MSQLFEAANDKRLEQYERHFLGQPALVELELRADDNDRASGIIDALAEQVLAEATAFALQHVTERFESAVAGAGDSAAMAAIIEQRVHRLLQHAFFVADDDFRGFELEQVFQAVIPVDHAPIQIVEIGSRKAAAFQWHQRAQVRRDHRQHNEDHPFRPALGRLQPLEQLNPFRDFLPDLFALGLGHRDLFA